MAGYLSMKSPRDIQRRYLSYSIFQYTRNKGTVGKGKSYLIFFSFIPSITLVSFPCSHIDQLGLLC